MAEEMRKRPSALAARQRKDFGPAEQAFQELVTESPGDAWARNQLALVLAQTGQTAERQRALDLVALNVTNLGENSQDERIRLAVRAEAVSIGSVRT